MTKHDKILFWIDHNLNNFLKKNTYYTDIEISITLDWLNNHAPEKVFNQIQKLSVDSAASQALSHHQKELSKHNYENKQDECLTVEKFNNGFSIVQLKKETSFFKESTFMRNCLFQSKPDESDPYDGLSYFFSLRDEDNKPHVSFHIQNQCLIQIKGFANSKIKFKYAELIAPWLNKNKIAIKDSNVLYYLNCVRCAKSGDILPLTALSNMDHFTMDHSFKFDFSELKYINLPKTIVSSDDLQFFRYDRNQLPQKIIADNIDFNNCTNISIHQDFFAKDNIYLSDCSNISNVISSHSSEIKINNTEFTATDLLIQNPCASIILSGNINLQELIIPFKVKQLHLHNCNNLQFVNKHIELKCSEQIKIDQCNQLDLSQSKIIADSIDIINNDNESKDMNTFFLNKVFKNEKIHTKCLYLYGFDLPNQLDIQLNLEMLSLVACAASNLKIYYKNQQYLFFKATGSTFQSLEINANLNSISLDRVVLKDTTIPIKIQSTNYISIDTRSKEAELYPDIIIIKPESFYVKNMRFNSVIINNVFNVSKTDSCRITNSNVNFNDTVKFKGLYLKDSSLDLLNKQQQIHSLSIYSNYKIINKISANSVYIDSPSLELIESVTCMDLDLLNCKKLIKINEISVSGNLKLPFNHIKK